MDLLDRFFRREYSPPPPVPINTGGNQPKGGSYRERIEYASSEESALRVAAVYRAADLRSNAMGMLKLRSMRRDEGKRCMVQDMTPEGRRLNYLLQVRANSRQNAFQFWKSVEMMRLFHGRCIISPRYALDGTLTALVPCHGWWDAIANTYHIHNTEHNIHESGVPAEEVLVLRGIVTRAHPEGESVISYAARTTSVAATIEALSLETAAKGGRQKLILQQKEQDGPLGLLDSGEMEEQARNLQERIYSEDVIYDNSGSAVTPINMSMQDLQILEQRKFSTADIARFFNVPRALLMDDTNSNYNTAEAATLEFMSRTLAPLIREAEDEFCGKLLTPGEFGMRAFQFDLSPLYALDRKTRGEYNKLRLETGCASVNELRAEDNQPAVDGGDEHYVTCNVAPLGSPKLSGKPTTPQKKTT